MRLTAVKLAGFKSFVDPTTFRAPTNLTGIVGPNGCGKSNIIDAVRWVMGEGSARVLRGELMSDVIFSGSASRKPVGTATVELLFDNADGKAGGEFADYAEISVKRQVSRDGISTYMLNGARVRRKDVRDLFLGTGVGARGYSIIEQGMISQVVDARPEQIRGYLEEAAGISRYKERRRETENRIGHTRDNLDRLADLREEVDNHLSRLQRQSRAAERYKKLKQQRRELRSRLLALQWKEQMTLAATGKEGLTAHETSLAEKVAEQRAAEAEMTRLREAQADANEAFNEVQGELYAVGSDIARLEQTIRHSREIHAQQRTEYEDVSEALKDLEQHMLLDRAQVDERTQRLAQLEPELSAAESAEAEADAELSTAETEVQQWQEQLEAHHAGYNELNRTADGLRASIEVLDQRMAGAASRLEALKGETEDVETGALVDELQALERKHAEAVRSATRQQQALDQARQARSDTVEALSEGTEAELGLQGRLLAGEGRLESLQALQQAGEDTSDTETWLTRQGLADNPRLLKWIKVQPGWELASEVVLGAWLQAVVTEGITGDTEQLGALENASLGLVQASDERVRPRTGTLSEKVTAPDGVIAMLNHVQVVDSIDEALEFLDLAGEEQSAVTRNGEWIGPGWAKVARGPAAQAGLLSREQEIEQLEHDLEVLRKDCLKRKGANDKLRESLAASEESIAALQGEVNELLRDSTQIESQLNTARERIADRDRRGEQIAAEISRLMQQQKDDESSVRAARAELEGVLGSMSEAESRRATLDERRGELLERRDAARTRAGQARARRNELAVETGSGRASLDSLNQSLQRMDTQVGQLQQRYVMLSEAVAKAHDPEQEHRGEMDKLLQSRVEIEARLAEARKKTQDLEAAYREQDGRRQRAMQEADAVRGALERARLQQQEVELNARNLQRQAEDMDAVVAELAEALPDDADAEQWQADIERMGVRISRLEPVNLAAIQEYEEELKRKEYLDAQHADLVDALETLEAAIAKIDRKTRTRFKDTFEAVNKGMQELFPRLFGGGHGYLEMTGEDLLTTGIGIMARPPGKRVSSIHLLSGGEKALTAVAFVFAIFQLNPAPFCLLDEVDAPLDDANVGRFSDLVKEMSDTVQFIVVTHNKITMEMVHQLSGVTMREPGVSRLVQVNIDEAARLAES